MAYEAEADQPEADSADNEPSADVELPSLATRIEWFEEWEEKTREARKLSRRDRDYYDNKQWTKEEIEDLKERCQPILTKNEIAPAINFILGEEIKKRVDPVARPKKPVHEDGARAATDSLRAVEEEQELDDARSLVAKNMLIEGYGGALKGIEEEDGEYKHLLTHIEWDRLFYDPHSRALDFADAMYRGIVVWRDLDDLLVDYPDKEAELLAAMSGSVGESDSTTEDAPRQWVQSKRKRIKIVEMYFRVGKDCYRADFTKGHDLRGPEKTAYLDAKHQRHSICPLVMASCSVDAEGMRYGVVRALVSPQDEINKRASKSLHLLSVRQVAAERDSAVRDPEKVMAELAKPDGYIELEPGALAENRFQILPTGDLAQGHIAMMAEAQRSFERIAPAAATVPDLPGSASGRAVMARLQSASQELGSFFDGLRKFTLAVYRLDWACIRQYWTEEKWSRVTDDQELTGYRFVALNRKMSRAERLQELIEKGAPPEKALATAAGDAAPYILAMVRRQMGQVPPEQQQQALVPLLLQHPLMAEQIVTNQVEQMDVDITLDMAPETAVIEQEEFEKFSELSPSLLQGGMDPREVVKMLIELSQFRDKRQVLQSLEKGPDPKVIQAQEQLQVLGVAKAKADVDVAGSQAQLNQARAQQVTGQLQIAGAKAPSEIEKNKASSMRDAAQAGAATGGR